MATLSELIIKHTGKGQGIAVYYSSSLPAGIAAEMTPGHVTELMSKLDEMSREWRDQAGILDGDDQDDLWRAQMRLASLFPGLIPRYPELVAAGVLSPEPRTRFFVALALEASPHRRALPLLERAKALDNEPYLVKQIDLAIKACKPKWRFW